MLIIRELFYRLDGAMDSSFLTVLHVCLGFFTLIFFFKMLIQFGLPNHPARFVSYLVGLSSVVYFCGLAMTTLNFISPWDWMRWRPLPLVAGSLCLLFQVIATIGNFSLIQQKTMSRLPLMGALVCFAIFPQQAEFFLAAFLLAGVAILTISVGKARYQKRLYYKMCFFLALYFLGKQSGIYLVHVWVETLLFLVLFYLFIFQQSFAISALVDDFKSSVEGE
jgi:hypothetical protein